VTRPTGEAEKILGCVFKLDEDKEGIPKKHPRASSPMHTNTDDIVEPQLEQFA
jgi:hypothetical protein